MRNGAPAAASIVLLLAACSPPSPDSRARSRGSDAALAAFPLIQRVLQHPRCRNCHIPGDAPLQYDAGIEHSMGVKRGAAGTGAPGQSCATCHGEANLPASYGAHAPPGAPHWKLPPASRKMVFIGLDAAALCETVRDPRTNGGKDLEALFEHVDKDELVLWGWDPGGEREPVDVPHAEFAAAFRTWIDGGAPCPEPAARDPA